jgi:hypothetical protein
MADEAAFMPFLGPPMPKLPKIAGTTLSCLDFAVNESLLDEHIEKWKTNKFDEPSPADLITGFMEVSWRNYTEPPKLTVKDKELELRRPLPVFWIKLALSVASRFDWDLQMIKKKLYDVFTIARSLSSSKTCFLGFPSKFRDHCLLDCLLMEYRHWRLVEIINFPCTL